MCTKRTAFIALITGMIFGWPFATIAAEVKFLCASALRPAMDPLVAEFQKTTGHKITVSYANLGIITDRVRKGVGADLAVTSPQQWEGLQSDGKIIRDFKVQIASVGLGFAVKKGATQLDLSSVEAVKRTLLNARAIVFGDPAHGSPSGADTLRLFDRLDVATQMKSKAKALPGSAEIIQTVAEGEADLGIIHTSVIAASPKVDLAGALPSDLKYPTIFVASIPNGAEQAEPAKAFVKFLTSPNAAMVFKSKGLEPG